MTKEDFIIGYLTRSGILEYRTPDGFKIDDCVESIALPCACGEDGCEGWAMVTNRSDTVKWHMFHDAPKAQRGPWP